MMRSAINLYYKAMQRLAIDGELHMRGPVLGMISLRSWFQQRSYLEAGPPNRELIDGFEPKSNSAASQDFTPVFLAHARLYTFADMRLVAPLKNLALYNLHKTLIDFRLYE
jgi:hypothetical protein